MTDMTFSTFRSTDASGLRLFARTIVAAYWWAQSVTHAYDRTGNVERSVSEAGVIA